MAKLSVVQVLAIYEDLKANKVDPVGTVDTAGRWFPAEEEAQVCCLTIRRPSVRWPYSLALHCRTIGHVARKYGFDPVELDGVIREQRRAARAAKRDAAKTEAPVQS